MYPEHKVRKGICCSVDNQGTESWTRECIRLKPSGWFHQGKEHLRSDLPREISSVEELQLALVECATEYEIKVLHRFQSLVSPENQITKSKSLLSRVESSHKSHDTVIWCLFRH